MNIEVELPLIYPNPAYNRIFIENIDMLNFTIEIIDFLGKFTQKVEDSNVDISSLNSGIYFMKFRNNASGEIRIEKFIKQ